MSFRDILGQAKPIAILQKALTSGKVAHAYLFTGSRGIGKTTLARLLAKAVNCTGREQGKGNKEKGTGAY